MQQKTNLPLIIYNPNGEKIGSVESSIYAAQAPWGLINISQGWSHAIGEESLSNIETLARAFAAEGLTAIIADHSGTYLNKKPEIPFSLQADLMIEVAKRKRLDEIAEEQNIPKSNIFMLGHSYGGYLATMSAAALERQNHGYSAVLGLDPIFSFKDTAKRCKKNPGLYSIIVKIPGLSKLAIIKMDKEMLIEEWQKERKGMCKVNYLDASEPGKFFKEFISMPHLEDAVYGMETPVKIIYFLNGQRALGKDPVDEPTQNEVKEIWKSIARNSEIEFIGDENGPNHNLTKPGSNKPFSKTDEVDRIVAEAVKFFQSCQSIKTYDF